MKYHISIVDDHTVFRKGLRMILENIESVYKVTESPNAELFINQLPDIKPDIIFMDIEMPYLNGIEATKQILTIFPNQHIIAMTSDDNISTIRAMLKAGARGYLLKDADISEIEQVVLNINIGKNFFSSNILLKLAEELEKEPAVKLTSRETEIIQNLCKGVGVSAIADKLFVSERTIEKHKANLFLKTGTTNTVNLVLWAIHHKIVEI